MIDKDREIYLKISIFIFINAKTITRI